MDWPAGGCSRRGSCASGYRTEGHAVLLSRDVAPAIRYFEDFHAGQVIGVGTVAVSEEDIIAFARQYDPQPMHVDPAAAANTIYGGLIASGWHTVSLVMRMLVENVVAKTVSRCSPGLDELRFPLQ